MTRRPKPIGCYIKTTNKHISEVRLQKTCLGICKTIQAGWGPSLTHTHTHDGFLPQTWAESGHEGLREAEHYTEKLLAQR